MADLISRAAAIDAVYYKPNHKMAIEVLKEVPAVDAVPVVHGRWTEQHVDYASDCAIDEVQTAKCSVCGLYHTTPYMYSFTDYKFCPNCGAKMDGERRENDAQSND